MRGLLTNKVIQGTLLYSIVGILTSGINVLLLPVLTRWMSPHEFGLLNSAMAISTLTLSCMTAGLGAAVVRYFHVYRDESDRFVRFFSSAFWFQIAAVFLLISLTLFLFGTGMVTSIASVDVVHLIPILMVIALNPPRDLGNQLLTTQENHKRASGNQLVSFAVGTCLSLVLIGVYDLGALGRLYGLVGGAVAAGLMLVWLPELRANLKWSIDKKEFKKALSYGLPYVPYSFAIAAMFSLDKLIIQHHLDLEQVGVYSAAKAVAMGMSFIFVAITKAWYPRFFSLRDAGKDKEALQGQWAILCILPLTVVGFVILGPVVFPLLVDQKYLSGQPLLPVLGMAIFAYGLFITQSSYITYFKKTLYLPLIGAAGVILNLMLAAYLIPKIETQGAAWATLSGYLMMILVLMAISQLLEKKFFERVCLPCVSILLAALGVWCSSQIPSGWLWGERLLLSCLACALFFVLWFSGNILLGRRGRAN